MPAALSPALDILFPVVNQECAGSAINRDERYRDVSRACASIFMPRHARTRDDVDRTPLCDPKHSPVHHPCTVTRAFPAHDWNKLLPASPLTTVPAAGRSAAP